MFPILIVDDSRQDIELAERVFRQARIVNPIHVFNSGTGCLDFLRKRYADDTQKDAPPPLILLDLAMPSMTGVQTIAAINGAMYSPSPWIVMLSGHGDVKQVRDGYQLGAKTFLT